VRADNPLFSCLMLADGPFTVYDLERLTDTPHHVVLAACDTARSHVTAGEEILGLAAALLQQHTATLVAPVVPVPDAETTALMITYHRLLIDRHSPASALAQAQERHRLEGTRARATAASFVCLGAGQ
jgi:CHAT domain-containing protein